MLFLCGCTKVMEQPSDEVRISVINECSCRIKIYRGSILVLVDDYDCEYINVLPLILDRGIYRIEAGNGFGRVVESEFEKKYCMEELEIIF